MLAVKVKHFALQVPDPVAMADWYVKHLGWFLLDGAGASMLEIYRNLQVPVPNYSVMDPVLIHLAFSSDEPGADRDRLVKAGANLVEDLTTTAAGDQLVMLRDPWGLAVQLVKRAEPMLA
jgi:predicted enzyme related to lactoylglutathione lyase